MSYIGVKENIEALAGLHSVYSGFGDDEMNSPGSPPICL